MKRIVLLSLIFLLTTATYSQVGIGTTDPDASSILDLSSTNKGLLIPRVNLYTNPVSNPADALLLYNTHSGNGYSKGFYYWTSAGAGVWKQLENSGGSNNSWLTSGNSGTDGGNNDFLGTTDNQNFVIKTNNLARTRITTKGQLEILNTGKSIFLGQENGTNDDLQNRANIFIGYQSGKSNRGSNNIIIGELGLSEDRGASSNIAIGKQALQMNGGSNNIVLGESALSANRTSNSNIVIGKQAAQSNSGSNNIVLGELALSSDRGASSNIVIGKNAGKENNGSKNVIIGENTLIANQGGSNNVLMGFEAGKILAGSNNTFVGYQAGLNALWNINNSSALGNGAAVTAANQIVLGNTAVSEVKTSGKLTIGEYTLPNTDGSPNSVLITNGSGIVSWQNGANKAYGEIFRKQSTTNVTVSGGSPIPFEASGPFKNVNSASNTQLEVTHNGVYRLTYTLSLDNISGGLEYYLTQGGVKIAGSSVYCQLHSQGKKTSLTRSMLIEVKETDSKIFRVESDSGNNNNVRILSGSSLSIELVD